jgi:hypothetical protein
MQDTKLQLLLLPVWWYTTGVTLMWQWVRRRISHRLRAMGLVLFMRHLSEPLYGDYTRSGRLISFFLRIALLIGKFIWLGLYCVLLIFVMALYLAIIPLSIVMILYQIVPI